VADYVARAGVRGRGDRHRRALSKGAKVGFAPEIGVARILRDSHDICRGMRLGPRLQPAGHAKRGHREPQERRSSRATARTNNFIEINGATDMSKKLEGKVAVVTGASKGI